MSFHAISAALKLRGLTPPEKFLLVVMASYANTDNTLWPSQKRLSDDTSIPERSIRRYLVILAQRGFISRQGRRAHGRRTSDMVTLNFLPATMATGGEEAASPAAKSAKTSGQNGHFLPATMATEPIIEPIREPVRAREASAAQEAASRALVNGLARRMTPRPPPKETPAQMAARLRSLA